MQNESPTGYRCIVFMENLLKDFFQKEISIWAVDIRDKFVAFFYFVWYSHLNPVAKEFSITRELEGL